MKKMTKKEMYAVLRDVVLGSSAELKDEMVSFIDHEVELLSNKKTYSRGKTKTQIENDSLKNQIVIELEVAPYRAGEIAEKMGISQNKATALLSQLVNEGRATRTVEKKIAYFTATPVDED